MDVVGGSVIEVMSSTGGTAVASATMLPPHVGPDMTF